MMKFHKKSIPHHTLVFSVSSEVQHANQSMHSTASLTFNSTAHILQLVLVGWREMYLAHKTFTSKTLG